MYEQLIQHYRLVWSSIRSGNLYGSVFTEKDEIVVR